MSEEKTLEEKMLEAIRHAHWQSNPSESKIAARKCAILAFEQMIDTLTAIMNQPITSDTERNAKDFISVYQKEIAQLKNTP